MYYDSWFKLIGPGFYVIGSSYFVFAHFLHLGFFVVFFLEFTFCIILESALLV